jgi:phytoene synthase
MTTNADHCAALVRDADRDRYLAALFAPARRRDALLSLYAFNAEIVRVRAAAREPMPGEIRLQWWREVIGGERDGEAAAHPVAAALQDARARYGLGPERFIGLIDAHAFDLYDEPMGTLDDLDRFGASTDGALFALAAQILGSENEALTRHAGLGYAIANTLSCLGQHAARRQLYVPLEVLERHGADREDVFARIATEPILAALAELRRHARRQLAAAKEELERADPHVLPALLPTALVGPQLRMMERANADPFRPQSPAPWRRQWLLWRAARQPRRIFAA